MSKLISVVVPVYNNEKTLEHTCHQIIDVHQNNFNHLILEIVFVNDGSEDGSWEELLRLKELYPEQITLINLSRNFGQLGALHACFNYTKGDAVICVSADLQDPISLISKMVSYWESGIEIVVCHRGDRKDGFFKRIFSRFAYSIARSSYPGLPKGGFDYWLMSQRVCQRLCALKGRHNFLQGNLLSMGFTKAFIPYTRLQRQEGRSGYSLGKKIKIIIDFLVDSSYIPIRAMSCLGMIFSFSGLIYSLLITYAWFQHETPFPGWAPLIIMLMIVGGIIMLMLGVIGEYIWRIYDNQKDFPLFIVDRIYAVNNIYQEQHPEFYQRKGDADATPTNTIFSKSDI